MLSVEELKTKSVFEIKSYAKKNNIDLQDAKTKIEMLNVIQGKEIVKIAKKELPEQIALYYLKETSIIQIRKKDH